MLQLQKYAFTTLSRLDESAYLYKGYLFATGQAQPFDPGIWTNKAPFAFLLHGYFQAIFAPGLRTARYSVIFMGFFILLGLWLTARRLGNEKIAAGLVWALVFTPAFIKIYSPAISQILVALMFIWALALALGEGRQLWQLSLSTALVSVMILTRQNMVIVLPLLILYIFWQHGRKAGIYAFISGAVVFIAGHIYWSPGIMELWFPWLPNKIADLIKPLYQADVIKDFGMRGGGAVNATTSMSSRLTALFRVYRFYPIIFSGILASIFLWKPDWKKEANKRAFIFLSFLFLILLLMHGWASLGQDYCVDCFTSYLGFFSASGMLLVALSIPEWKKEASKYLYPLIILLILIISTGVGFSAFEDFGDTLLHLEIPRLKNGRILLSGTTELGTVFINKFNLERLAIRQILAAGVGFGAGIVFLGSVAILFFAFFRKRNYNFGYILLTSFFIFSMLASPFIAATEREADYDGNIIVAYEAAGEYLAKYIPAQSTVYWDGGTSMVPLLYIPGGVEIYLPQLNAYNNYRIGGDAEQIYDAGFWNDALQEKWMAEAEFIVVNNAFFTAEWDEYLSPNKYDEFPPSPIRYDLDPNFYLRIFRKK